MRPTILSGILALSLGLPALAESKPQQDCLPCAPQPAVSTVNDTKPWEGALAFSQTLSQWALLIVAGSIVVLVGSSYRRPRILTYRLIYMCFLPGWLFLGYSLYYGMQVQQKYVAFILKTSRDATDTSRMAEAIRSFLGCQRWSLEWALVSFGLWLVLYLLWWLFNQEPEKEGN